MICKYTGLPYDFRTRNCWHHVINVRADNGIYTPDFDCASPDMILNSFVDGRQKSKGLTQVSEPQNFDAVLMKTKHFYSVEWHSGVYFDGYVSHCSRRAKQVIITPLSEIIEQSDGVEFWR